MFIRALLLSSLALTMSIQAQDGVVSSQSGAAGFYRAYFLDKERANSSESTTEAIALYKAFLAGNASHELADLAAARCVVLIYSTGEVTAAQAFAKKHSERLAKIEPAIRKASQARLRGRFSRGGRGGRGGGESKPNPNQAVIDTLTKAVEAVESAERRRIGAAVSRLGGRIGGNRSSRGSRGSRGNRGSRGGRGRSRGISMPKISGMKAEEAKAAVDKLVSGMETAIDALASQGKADQADALEGKLDKIQDLVDDGKLVEAQKIIDSIDVSSLSGRGRSNRGRRGGGQEGGRRRGGRDEEGGENKEGENKEGENKEGKEGEEKEGRRRRRR